MDAIERAAFTSVGRACGFAGLAILCLMIGLSHEPRLAAETGGFFAFGMTLFLVYRAKVALKRPYRDTETWLILEDWEKPARSVAQEVIGRALREAYVWFARHTAFVTVVLWIAVIGLRGFGSS
jgi:hypothetical protein